LELETYHDNFIKVIDVKNSGLRGRGRLDAGLDARF
jgi:hypothetical protein